MPASIYERVERSFGPLIQPRPDELATAWDAVGATLPEVMEYAGEPGIYPYGRKKIFATDEVELIVMGTGPPAGSARRTTMGLHSDGSTFLAETWNTSCTRWIRTTFPRRTSLAPRNAGPGILLPARWCMPWGIPPTSSTVTVHIYAPPITLMKVYDLERCSVCVVSDDCGAWWPTDQRQLLEVMRLDRAAASRSLVSEAR